MEEWKEYKLGDILNFRRGHDLPKSEMRAGNIPVAGSNGIIGYHDTATPVSPCITIGRSGNVGTPYIYDKCWAHNTVLYVDDFKGNNPLYLFYLLKTLPLSSFGGGSAVPTLNRNHIHPLLVHHTSDLKLQERIAKLLKSLDDKIECNRRINDNLEKQAQALFKSWFVDFEPFKDGEFMESEMGMIPKRWKVKSLSGIADYRNGLAMQKFRPLDGEIGLPVLKIKELGQGLCDDSSELCSPSMIGEKYIVNDGDIIFSWSGTLMVKLWCGGKCGLNQHLFLVDPQGFPNWFVYQWTKHHLDNFIRIAKDKAVTMGHIKRGELDKAKVVVPNEKGMCNINALMEPLFKQTIAIQIESRRLAQLRDTLLPRLMSGELKVEAGF